MTHGGDNHLRHGILDDVAWAIQFAAGNGQQSLVDRHTHPHGLELAWEEVGEGQVAPDSEDKVWWHRWE